MNSPTGCHVSRLSSRLEPDSIPINWILFRIQRPTIPHPGQWASGLADASMEVPEKTERALAASEIAKMAPAMTQPALMITELSEDYYSLGSAWLFLGGLPEVNGRRNKRFSGIARMRILQTVEDGRALVILSREVQPGLVALLRILEIDGRRNLKTWAVIDTEREAIVGLETTVARRPCDMCLLTSDICDPRQCKNEQSFEAMRNSKRSLLEKMEKPVCHMEMFSGKWVMAIERLEPIEYNWSLYFSGSSYQYALISVLQGEVESIHPPRASFRIVKKAREEMDHFLDLETLLAMASVNDAVRGIGGKASRVNGAKLDLASSEKKKPGASGHLCETCGKIFKRAYDLKRHVIVVHQKIKDFKCSYCGQLFTQSGHLHEHVRMAHTGALHACSICERKFGTKSKLDRHVRAVHYNERNFRCSECQLAFKDKAYLRKHVRKQHNMDLKELENFQQVAEMC
mmetsp:Transcript_12515/g.50916  ORF Transcript_12515/g.50916 Transcript_12515/m.50916 type:complete len:459 (-) Transcript_12515:249-1625(-)|eukprot:CAMPEP_0113961788 /NCGR_PEP_ID=MMETSP0011_2-20120614/5525_1 /TAXON_ID=101924 /ORGANISM="Rhodosorus marinus" /LENGTH=458 /DNA_ID=CAMNT_0000973511 /DNA_START=253 /DNA_END=1629 /DNA_ORIENTATION=- /assembly_acc=CAM_ASM_000156